MSAQGYFGVWPTMITPFTDANKPDFQAMEKMVEWYIAKGCDGIFAVCQSSEMFFLGPREKLDIAKCVKDAVGGRIKVIASGHTEDGRAAQKKEIEAMAKLGLDAIVLVSNRLAGRDEGEDVFRANANDIFDSFPDVAFGIYECPYPYKRLVSTQFLKDASERMSFLKDTCCDPVLERERAVAVGSGRLALFNANTTTLLGSLRSGYKGYNGVMANFHPELYAWLYRHYGTRPEKCEELSDLLSVLAMSENRLYPVIAKYHFAKIGIPMSLHTRSADASRMDANDMLSIDAMIRLEARAGEMLGL